MTRREALGGLLLPGAFIPRERWVADGQIRVSQTASECHLTMTVRRGTETDSNTVAVSALQGGRLSDAERREAEVLGRRLLVEWLQRKNR